MSHTGLHHLNMCFEKLHQTTNQCGDLDRISHSLRECDVFVPLCQQLELLNFRLQLLQAAPKPNDNDTCNVLSAVDDVPTLNRLCNCPHASNPLPALTLRKMRTATPRHANARA